jgi:hypothetical protein
MISHDTLYLNLNEFLSYIIIYNIVLIGQKMHKSYSILKRNIIVDFIMKANILIIIFVLFNYKLNNYMN